MLASIPISYYTLAALGNFVTSSVLAILVIFRNPKSHMYRIFSQFSFTVAGWSFFYFLWLIAPSAHLAEFYLRTLMIFVVFIPTCFTHFILTLLKKGDSHQRVILMNYLVSFAIGLSVYTRLFAYDIGPFLVFPYWLRPGIFFSFHAIHFFVNILYAHFLMLQSLKVDSGILKKQVLYVFIGTAIGFVAGAINYLTWYRVPITPFLNPLVSLYVATFTYAILRHRLMDITVVIRRSIIYSLILGIFTGVLLIGVFLFAQFFSAMTGTGSLVVAMITLVIAGITLQPLRNLIEKWVDRSAPATPPFI